MSRSWAGGASRARRRCTSGGAMTCSRAERGTSGGAMTCGRNASRLAFHACACAWCSLGTLMVVVYSCAAAPVECGPSLPCVARPSLSPVRRRVVVSRVDVARIAFHAVFELPRPLAQGARCARPICISVISNLGGPTAPLAHWRLGSGVWARGRASLCGGLSSVRALWRRRSGSRMRSEVCLATWVDLARRRWFPSVE